MEELVLMAAAALGISPVTLIMMIPLIVGLSNVITRLIPDDATGILKVVRILTKIIGIYAANRVTSGISVNDVAKTFADGVKGADSAKDRLADLGIKDVNSVLNGTEIVRNPFPTRDPVTGKFVRNVDGNVTHRVALVFFGIGALLMLSACATTKTWLANPCKYAVKAQRVIDVAQQVVNQCPTYWANPQ